MENPPLYVPGTRHSKNPHTGGLYTRALMALGRGTTSRDPRTGGLLPVGYTGSRDLTCQ